MANFTHAITTASTASATSYTTGSFTPALNDLLIVMSANSNSLAGLTCSSSAGLTFTTLSHAVTITDNSRTLAVFIANELSSSASQTVTVSNGDAGTTGTIISVVRLSGMLLTGNAAVRQEKEERTVTGTPSPSFSLPVLSYNPTLAIISNSSNPTTVSQPTGWTGQGDNGYSTPSTGLEYATRNSGFDGTDITWGSTTPTECSNPIYEFNAPPSTGNFFLFF